MTVQTTKLNGNGNNLVVVANKKYGDAKKYTSSNQAHNAAEKLLINGINVKVSRPAMSRCFYLEVL